MQMFFCILICEISLFKKLNQGHIYKIFSKYLLFFSWENQYYKRKASRITEMKKRTADNYIKNKVMGERKMRALQRESAQCRIRL